jgi:hypothetical protein
VGNGAITERYEYIPFFARRTGYTIPERNTFGRNGHDGTRKLKRAG